MRALLGIVVLATAVLLLPTLRAEESGDAAAPAFPDSWVGHWRGPATLSAPGRPDLTFTMELRVTPLEDGEGYAWLVAFRDHAGADPGHGDQVHSHVLRPVDAAKGHWQVDHRNSIKLDSFFLGNALHTRFDMGQNSLDARYVMQDGAIEFHSTNFRRSALSVTGGKEGAPVVSSYELGAVQSARMIRVEDEE